MFVLYDLPVDTPARAKAATKFREYLLDQSFEMVQYSIYKRFCGSLERFATVARRIERNLPGKGQVRILPVTDKQFGAMQIFDCAAERKERRESVLRPKQLQLF